MTEPQKPVAQAANPQLACVLAWVLPGAGHFFLKRRGRALAYCGLIAAALVVGISLQGNLYRIVGGQPLTILATLGSMGMGIPYFALRWVAGYVGNPVSPGYEYGSAFLLTAGLMNLLLVVDAWDIANGRKE